MSPGGPHLRVSLFYGDSLTANAAQKCLQIIKSAP